LQLSPKVVVQAAPEKEPYLQAGGKILGKLRDLGVEEQCIKVDVWGPPILRVCRIPPGGGRPVKLATWSVQADWTIVQSELSILKAGLQVAQLQAELKA